VLKAIPPIQRKDLLRGQFRGYLDEKGVTSGSQVETYSALRMQVKSWRWDRVPFFICAGKNLPITRTEVLARLRKPPTTNTPEPESSQNYIRIRISPERIIAIAVSVSSMTGAVFRQEVEMIATRHARPAEMESYEPCPDRCYGW
jgi:glucose-6-phosphate 1-dehydrogenase